MILPPVDTHDFTRLGESASGRLTPEALPRLSSMLVSQDGELDWQLEGRSDLRADGSRESFMDLRFSARLTMQCARCLEPLEIALADRHTYRLVGSESQADREDADDDERDDRAVNDGADGDADSAEVGGDDGDYVSGDDDYDDA